nr:hypothetical protein [Azospirillum baldaniorum]
MGDGGGAVHRVGQGDVHGDAAEAAARHQRHAEVPDEQRRQAQQCHGAVEAAVVEPVGVAHRHPVGPARVVDLDLEAVRAGAQMPGQFDAEGRRGAAVRAEELAVEEDARLVGGGADVQDGAFTGLARLMIQRPRVPGPALVVPPLRAKHVPAGGNRGGLPRAVVVIARNGPVRGRHRLVGVPCLAQPFVMGVDGKSPVAIQSLDGAPGDGHQSRGAHPPAGEGVGVALVMKMVVRINDRGAVGAFGCHERPLPRLFFRARIVEGAWWAIRPSAGIVTDITAEGNRLPLPKQ